MVLFATSACRARQMVAERRVRFGIQALVVPALLAACAAPAQVPPADGPPPHHAECGPRVRLTVGQTCRLRVDARQRESQLPLELAAGDRYLIELPAGQQWNDWGRDAVDPLVGDDGHDSSMMKLGARFKRMPSEPYMTLGATMRPTDRCHGLRVGPSGLVVTLASAGEIVFFANDVPMLNRNNGGSVWVNVKRLAAP